MTNPSFGPYPGLTLTITSGSMSPTFGFAFARRCVRLHEGTERWQEDLAKGRLAAGGRTVIPGAPGPRLGPRPVRQTSSVPVLAKKRYASVWNAKSLPLELGSNTQSY